MFRLQTRVERHDGLSVREGYGLWAPSYADETAISFLETELAENLTPPLGASGCLTPDAATGGV